MNNFIVSIRAESGLLALDDAMVTSLAERIEAFNQALDLTLSPSTRTTVMVGEKKLARRNATDAVREVVRLIKANPQVDDAKRVSLGLPPRGAWKSGAKISEIATCPDLEIESIEHGGHVLRFSDSDSPQDNRLPDLRYHLLLFAVVSSEPVTDASEARFVGVYTKKRITTSFAFDHERRYVTYFARWGVMNNVVGPWSAPLVATLAFASPNVAKKRLKLVQAA